MDYFVWLNDRREGPFSEEAIQEMLQDAKINSETPIFAEGFEDWIAAKTHFPNYFEEGFENKIEAPPLIPPPVISVHPRWFGKEAPRLVVTMSASAPIVVAQVRLYDETLLRQFAVAKAEAAELLEGVKDPYVAFGGPLWVVTTGIASRALEVYLSKNAEIKGAEMLRRVIEQEKLLRRDERYFPIGNIQEIDQPFPQLWKVNTGPSFIHEGGDFIAVIDDSGRRLSLRWSLVQQYEFCENHPETVTLRAL